MRVIPYFQLETYTERNGILRKTRKRRSRSFVQQFLKLHYLMSNESGTDITITDIDGTSRTRGASSNQWKHTFLATAPGRGGSGCAIGGAISTDTDFKGSKAANNGIVLGTGSTAIAPTDFQLATLIADGTSASQLEYFSSAGGNFSISGGTGSFVLERLFRNSSGGTITVNEMGVYVGGFSLTNNQGFFHFCVLRDLVSPGFAITNGAYARATYTISITV